MKKIVFTLFTVLFGTAFVQAQNIGKCGSDEYNHSLRATDPEAYEAQMKAFEAAWREYQIANANDKKLGKTNEKYTIPVVFHIFHENGAENLSDAQINGMLSELNKYYNADPALVSGVRPIFKPLISNCNFEFKLARKDPNGNCTNGIIRVQTNLTGRATNEIKKLSTWDTKRYLNIWVARSVFSNGRAVGGFAQLPFGFGSSSTTDGLLVVASQSLADNTVAHEIGHSLGLYHPFEGSREDSCGDGDEVKDTPPTWFLYAEGSNNSGRGNQCGNPNFNTCGSVDTPDMQENIMDYFSGPCSGTMFTLGQYERMKFCLTYYRRVLFSQENLIATGVLDPVSACAPIPAFGVKSGNTNTFGRQACVGSQVSFSDLSYNGVATSWSWNFGEGATPATSTDKNPANVTYSTPGYKTITLTVSNATGSNTKTWTNEILISQAAPLGNIAYAPDVPTAADGWEMTSEGTISSWIPSNTGVLSGYQSMLLPFDPFGRLFSRQFALVSPSFDLSAATSPYFKFAYAFAQTILTATENTADELNIQVSTNCGLTWSNLRPVVTGNNLGTVSALASNVTFTPVNNSIFNATSNPIGQWKEISILSNAIPKSSNVRFRILYQSANGNNLYVDNIQLGQRTGLKELTASDINLLVSPNPFNTTTKLSYSLVKSNNVEIEVYDVVGKKMATLFNGTQQEGVQEITFDRTEHNLNSGLYFVKFNIEGSTFTQKVIVN